MTDNPQMIAISRLAENLAPQVQAALDHLRNERHTTDGYPAGGNADGGSRSTDTTSSTERTAMIRDAINQREWQLKEEIRAAAQLLSDIRDTCTKAIGHRAPTAPQPMCRDADVAGWDGYLDGGWHDPLCTNYSRTRKGGLCNTCRVRVDRWRKLNERKPLDDERALDHDSEIRVGERGTVHALPVRGAA